MSIQTSRYVIANVGQGNCACLLDSNDETSIGASHSWGAFNAQWIVKRLDNGRYFIENAEQTGRYANAGHYAKIGATVDGRAEGQQWEIKETRVQGQYTIATIDTDRVWTLYDKGIGTPIALSDLYHDPKSWWIFERSKIDGEHDDDGPFNNNASPGLLIDIESSISGATDLRGALKSTSEALRKALEVAQTRAKTNEGWEMTSKRLLFHVDTIENQNEKLEEDFGIEGVIPSPDPTVIRSLKTYASLLNNIYQLLCDDTSAYTAEAASNTKTASNEAIVTQAIRDTDVIFGEYTTAIHDFSASSIIQILPGLPQSQSIVQTREVPHSDQLSLREDTYLQRGMSTMRNLVNTVSHKLLKTPNVYGIQHGTCLEGTREKSQEAIRKWSNDRTNMNPIFLLLDVAGSGKSTVAKHMAEEWTHQGRLVARFFFSRDTESTMSTTFFCSTVANAFIALDQTFEAPIKAFRDRPDYKLLSFRELFDGLIKGPLQSLKRDAILIIDALDECNNEDGSRRELLNTIQSQWSSRLRLRILATGRPERDIRLWAQEFRVEYANFFQLEGGYNEVEIYVKYRLRHHRRTQEDLCSIITHADGVFIWARISCDLIDDNADVDGLLGELGKEVSLDHLYQVALHQSIPKNERSHQAFCMVLQMILASREPLSIEELEVLAPTRDIVDQIVSRLGALLRYNDRRDPIRLLHATFREFLTTRSKAGIYFIQPELGHHRLTLGCLKVIGRHSHLDTLSIRYLHPLTQKTYVYSSNSWVHHCMLSCRKLGLNRQVLEFVNSGLKPWAVVADTWHPLDTVSCLKDALSFSRQTMSPHITEMAVHYSLETV